MSRLVKDLVTELPKSPLPAGFASEGSGFVFFVSGPKPLECEQGLIDGEAIVLSTGGNAAIHYGKGNFSYSTDCWALEPLVNLVDGKYLYYFLDSQIFRIDALGFEGSGLKHLRKDFVRNYKVPEFSKPEQCKITEVLSTVDRAIEQTEALIAKQQRIKIGLMQNLLTRGIDKHGNLRSEETHQFKDSPLGRIPVEWEVAPISKYGSRSRPYLRTGPFGSDLNTKHWVEYGIPVLTIGSLGEGIVLQSELLFIDDKTADRLKGFRVEEGDIVFSRVADIGRSLVIKPGCESWIISSNLMRISLDKKAASPDYLYRNIAFNSEIRAQLRKTSNSGGRDLVNGPILNALIFPWPSIDEQLEVNKRLQGTDNRLKGINENLQKLYALKTGLMQDLLTGKVPVTPLIAKMEDRS